MFELSKCKRERTFVTGIENQNARHECGYQTPCSFTGNCVNGYEIHEPQTKHTCSVSASPYPQMCPSQESCCPQPVEKPLPECCACPRGMTNGLRLNFKYTWQADRMGEAVSNDAQGQGNCGICANQAQYWNGIYTGGYGVGKYLHSGRC